MHKKDLKKILYLDDLIDSKYRQLDELKNKMLTVASPGFSTDKIQSTKKSDPVGDRTCRYLDLYNEIQNDIDRLTKYKNKARVEISKLEPPHSTVLEMRYLECMEWKEISNIMHYSLSHIYHLHGEALQLINSSK